MKTLLSFTLGTLLVVAGSSTAMATTLNCDTTTTCSAATNFGNIVLTQNAGSPQTVTVNVTLSSGDKFVTTGTHHAFSFSISGDPAVSITGLTPGYSVGPTNDNNPGYPSFNYSINCTGCGSGGSGPVGSTLSFTVALTGGGNLLTSAFTTSGGFSFAADIIQNCTAAGCAGPTGVVGSNQLDPSTTPEPSTTILLISGFVALGLGKAKRALFS